MGESETGSKGDVLQGLAKLYISKTFSIEMLILYEIRIGQYNFWR